MGILESVSSSIIYSLIGNYTGGVAVNLYENNKNILIPDIPPSEYLAAIAATIIAAMADLEGPRNAIVIVVLTVLFINILADKDGKEITDKYTLTKNATFDAIAIVVVLSIFYPILDGGNLFDFGIGIIIASYYYVKENNIRI